MYKHTERILLAPSVTEKIVGVDVRFESQSSLRLSRTNHLLPTNEELTPFPIEVKDLMDRYSIMEATWQVSHQPWSSFPRSSLNSIPSLDNQRHSGSSGIIVSLKMRNDDREIAKTAILNFLRDLVAQRLILAPLSSIDCPRLHRYRKVDHKEGVTHFTTILPMEGSPVAAEGMLAFQSFSPCQNHSGLWSGTDADGFSAILLGRGAVPGRQRSLWMSFQSNCHNNNDQNECEYNFTQGLEYTIVSKKATVSLSDIYGKAETHAYWSSCPFADFTEIELIPSKNSSRELNFDSKNTGLGPSTDAHRRLLSKNVGFMYPIALFSGREPSYSYPNPFWNIEQLLLRRQGIANKGTIISTVRNDNICSATIRFSHCLPPIVQPIWHSFTVEMNGEKLQWSQLSKKDIKFHHDGQIDIFYEHVLPAKSSIRLSLDYDPVYLPFEQLPGDPNRGIELSPVRAIFSSLCSNDTAHLFSESLLLMSPLPDTSMPFNVLSLSCTLYAFIIGSIMNLLIRKASEKVKYTLDPSQKPKSKFQSVKDRLKGVVSKIMVKPR